MPDDGLFYLIIADNVASGFGSTFDRISATNGYHPLWLLMLSGVIYLVNGTTTILRNNTDALLKLALCFYAFISLLSFALSIDLLRRLYKNIHKTFIIVFACAYFVIFVHCGLMETAISLLLVLVFIRSMLDPPRVNKWLLSLILAGMILSRLDNVVVVGLLLCYSSYIMSKQQKRPILGVALSLSIFPVILVGAYLLSNYIFFGKFITVSMDCKSIAPSLANIYRFFRHIKIYQLFRLTPIFAAIGTVIPIIIFNRYYRRNHVYNIVVFVLFAYIARIVVTLVLTRGVTVWYLAEAFIFCIMLWLIWCNECMIRTKPHMQKIISNIMVFTTVLVLSSIIILTAVIFRSEVHQYDFCMKSKEKIPEDAVIYCIDRCGVASFVAGYRVINGDGLVNSFEYLRYIEEGSLREYFAYAKPSYYLELRHLRDKKKGIIVGRDFFKMKCPTGYLRFSRDNLVMKEDYYGGRVTYYLFKFDPMENYFNLQY